MRGKPKFSISYRMPADLYSQIEDFTKRREYEYLSDSITKLLEFALYMEKRLEESEEWTPEQMEEIKAQLDEGKLVDWVQNIDHKKLQIITDIFNVEREARNKQQRITKY